MTPKFPPLTHNNSGHKASLYHQLEIVLTNRLHGLPGTVAGVSSQPARVVKVHGAEPADLGQGGWADVAVRGRAPLCTLENADGLNHRIVCLSVKILFRS